MTRNALVDRCKEIIKEAYEEATEMIVAYLELHPSEATQTLAKEIDSENWQALDSRIRRRQMARKAVAGADSAPSRTPQASARRHAKSVLRKTPEIVVDLTPSEQRAVAQKLDEAAAIRQKLREQASKQKEREHLGDETIDDLEAREELQSTEYLLITARGNLRGFVKHVGEIGIANTPESWRESCLDWVNDLEGHLGMAKALLAGDNIDWAAFDDLLAKEGS